MPPKTGRPVYGVIKPLKKAFYPDYSYKKSISLNGGADHKSTNSKAGVKKVKGGKRTGIGFDTSIGASVRLWQLYGFPFDVFFNDKSADAVMKSLKPAHRKQLKTLNKRRVPYTRFAWQLMRKLKVRPIGTQLRVKHPGMKLDTNMDLKVIDEKGRNCTIELKTVTKGYYTKANGMMKAPFQDLPNSPDNQHMLQLTTTDELNKMTNPTELCGDAMVWLFAEDGVDVLYQRPLFKDRVGAMFDELRKVVKA